MLMLMECCVQIQHGLTTNESTLLGQVNEKLKGTTNFDTQKKNWKRDEGKHGGSIRDLANTTNEENLT